MKEYVSVWEIYSEQWVLLEKGNKFFIVDADQHLLVEMTKFCERKAEERNISTKQIIFSSVQKV